MTITNPMFPPSIVPAASPTSRRSLLMGLAAAATVPAPALATAMGGLPASQAPDPIFAVIAEHRAAQEAVYVTFGANDLDDDEDPNKAMALERATAAEWPLFTTAPTTVAGAAALLQYVGSDAHETWQNEVRGSRDTVLSYASRYEGRLRAATHRFPLHVGAALRRMIGTAVVREIAPAEPDPIFAAIERHRQARSKLSDVVAAADLAFDDPQYDAMQKPLDKANRKEMALSWKLIEIEPTTAAGLTAIMQYVVEIGDTRRWQWPDGWEHELLKACLRSTEALIDGARA